MMATLFSNVTSTRWPDDGDDSNKVIIVAGQVIEFYPPGGHVSTRYLVTEDFDLIAQLELGEISVRGRSDATRGRLQISPTVNHPPQITIECFGDMGDVLLRTQCVTPQQAIN